MDCTGNQADLGPQCLHVCAEAEWIYLKEKLTEQSILLPFQSEITPAEKNCILIPSQMELLLKEKICSISVARFEKEEPAFVAQSDAHPTGDQEVVGLIPAGSGNSFVEIDHEIFPTVILSLLLIQEGQLSVSVGRMCTSTS